ncbi:hypothetical protein ACHAWF_003656, partial [Thalassiosira exigua]
DGGAAPPPRREDEGGGGAAPPPSLPSSSLSSSPALLLLLLLPRSRPRRPLALARVGRTPRRRLERSSRGQELRERRIRSSRARTSDRVFGSVGEPGALLSVQIARPRSHAGGGRGVVAIYGARSRRGRGQKCLSSVERHAGASQAEISVGVRSLFAQGRGQGGGGPLDHTGAWEDVRGRH